MLHVLRNPDGTIHSIAREAQPGSNPLDETHPDIQRFLHSDKDALDFSSADADFVRVIEDVIDTLIAKNIIRHTDLPAAAQQKLVLRKGLRSRLAGALNLLDSDDRIL